MAKAAAVVEDAATAIALRRNMVNFFAVRSEGGGGRLCTRWTHDDDGDG